MSVGTWLSGLVQEGNPVVTMSAAAVPQESVGDVVHVPDEPEGGPLEVDGACCVMVIGYYYSKV